MRKKFLKTLLCFLIIPSLFISCTTSDGGDEESVDAELSTELEGVDSDAVANGEETEFDDFDTDTDASKKDKTKTATDDEFFAEDAENPSGSPDMAEKDLQKELEKSDSAAPETAVVAAETSEAPPVEEPPPTTPAATSGSVGLITSKETPISSDGFETVAPSITVPNEDLGISDPLVADVDPPLPAEKAAQENVPVSKIRKEPYFSKKGRWINAVYIARQGDDLGTISQKLFEKDNTSILIEDNEGLDDGISMGEKVYYNSPTRPDDKKELLTYYEDKKMPVQYYITKRGDNIYNIGREVLGHDEGWKEIWAINESLQTQALLPAGLKIRYWSGNELQAPPPEAPIMATTDATSSPNTDVAGSVEPATSTTDGPESLPDLTQDASGDDPSISSPAPEAIPMPSEIATSAPSAAPVSATESGGSLLTIAGIAIIGLAVITLVSIQIKNRKKDDHSIPPSLEFTKV